MDDPAELISSAVVEDDRSDHRIWISLVDRTERIGAIEMAVDHGSMVVISVDWYRPSWIWIGSDDGPQHARAVRERLIDEAVRAADEHRASISVAMPGLLPDGELGKRGFWPVGEVWLRRQPTVDGDPHPWPASMAARDGWNPPGPSAVYVEVRSRGRGPDGEIRETAERLYFGSEALREGALSIEVEGLAERARAAWAEAGCQVVES